MRAIPGNLFLILLLLPMAKLSAAVDVEVRFAEAFLGQELCVDTLEDFVRLRAEGTRAIVHVLPSRLLTNFRALDTALANASVGRAERTEIAREFLYFSQVSDLHPIAKDTVTRFAADSTEEWATVPEVVICVLSGDCTWPFGGTALPRAQYRAHSGAEGSEGESIGVSLRFHAEGPGTFIIMSKKDSGHGDSTAARITAFQWVGLFFHEFRHHLNGRLLNRWLRANHFLDFAGRRDLQDGLFRTYRKEIGGKDSLDDGFTVLFEESTATYTQTWISHRMALRDSPTFVLTTPRERFDLESSLLPRASSDRAGPVVKQFQRFRRQDYGRGILRVIDKGITLNGRNQPVNEKNFFSIAEALWKIVHETIERAERLGFTDAP